MILDDLEAEKRNVIALQIILVALYALAIGLIGALAGKPDPWSYRLINS